VADTEEAASIAGERWVADSSLSPRFPIYTRANVGEVFPDPVTPLTYDSGLWLAELGWRDAWERMGAFDADEFPSDDYAQLGVVGGYCYLNASLIRLFGERAPGLSWQLIDDQFFGAQPGIPPYQEEPGDVRPDLTERIGATFGWALSVERLSDLTELIDDMRATKRLRNARPDLSAMSDGDLVARYRELIELHRNLFSHHLFASYMATVPLGIIQGVSSAVGRPDLLMVLIAGVGEVDSAAPSMALWELGRVVAASPELQAAFGAGVAGLTDRLEASGSQAAQAFLSGFQAFQHDYGSRGPNEWETRSPTWETRPELALSAIDRMRLAPATASPDAHLASQAAAREAAAAGLLAMVEADPDTHGQLAAALRAATVWLPARERTKTNNIRLIHEGRMTLRELGRRMVDRGAFDAVEDFGFLRLAEMEGPFLDDPHAFTDDVRRRRAQYLDLSAREPTFVFVGDPPDPATWPRRDDAVFEGLTSGASLQGIPGCAGVAEGRARVVLDSNDPSALDPGDVLVAPITDPSWTPLFVPAAAVVVDVGAPLSHAVIVSRELGIPCVVSAIGATRSIPDGARVRVDGSTGVVTVL
jgi:phosphohistidine swiveling domain-containing protein